MPLASETRSRNSSSTRTIRGLPLLKAVRSDSAGASLTQANRHIACARAPARYATALTHFFHNLLTALHFSPLDRAPVEPSERGDNGAAGLRVPARPDPGAVRPCVDGPRPHSLTARPAAGELAP